MPLRLTACLRLSFVLQLTMKQTDADKVQVEYLLATGQLDNPAELMIASTKKGWQLKCWFSCGIRHWMPIRN